MEARGLLALGVLTAMEGRFDEARRMAARGRAILGDVGFKILSAAYSQSSAYVEMLAGDPREAERELRSGYADLEKMGEKGYLSTVAAELAQALYEQRQFDEAERFTHVSQELGPLDDYATQVEWRGTRAKLLAKRGEFDAAVTLAEEAVALAADTDYLNLQGDICRDSRRGAVPRRKDRRGGVAFARGARGLRTQGERRLGRTGQGDAGGRRDRPRPSGDAIDGSREEDLP